MNKILFLAANPTDSTRLRLDVEIRTIDEKLHQAELSHLFKIEQHWAVRVRDLQGLILRHKPNIIHFSGHGSKDSGIVLEDETGNSRAVSAQALGKMFSVLKDNISCVILNSCYSESQARAIADHIDYVIGMSEAITDAAAISFSCAFYQAMGYGRDLGDAFDLGCIQIDLENLEEHDTPRLFLKGEMTEPTRTTIDIVTVGSSFLSSLGKALQLANSVQREFGFHLLENELTNDIRMNTFNENYAPEFFAMIEKKKNSLRSKQSFLIVVTDSAFHDSKYSNLFGSHRASKRLAAISTKNVPDLIIPSDRLEAYFLYYLARYTLSFLKPKHKNHDDTRFCIFDRKVHKLDLLKSMKARSICDECRRKLLSGNDSMSANQLQALDELFCLAGDILIELA